MLPLVNFWSLCEFWGPAEKWTIWFRGPPFQIKNQIFGPRGPTFCYILVVFIIMIMFNDHDDFENIIFIALCCSAATVRSWPLLPSRCGRPPWSMMTMIMIIDFHYDQDYDHEFPYNYCEDLKMAHLLLPWPCSWTHVVHQSSAGPSLYNQIFVNKYR